MSLSGLIITIAVLGLIMWAVNKYVPMEGNLKKLLNIAVVIITIVWILHKVGAFGMVENIHL